MAVTIKLSDIIDSMEFQLDESSAYLNRKTGEITTVMDDEFRAAEEDNFSSDFLGVEEEAVETARKILDSDDYISLPTKFDIHEYAIMERFCLSLSDEKLSDSMYRSIKGRGAFRRFKDNIHRYDVAEEWYRYRRQEIRDMAIEWCELNGVTYND